MGQEIFYCSGCQTRLKGSEFDAGNAFLIFNKPCCRTCTIRLLPTLPPEQQHQVTEILNRPARPVTPRRVAAFEPRLTPPPEKKPWLWITLGGAAAAVLLVAVILSSTAPSPKKPAAMVQTPESPPPVLPDPIPPALERARREHADDLAAQIKDYKKVVWDLEGTKYFAAAKQELDALLAKRKAALERELAKVDEEIRAPEANREYGTVLELLRNIRSRFEDPEWAAMVDKKISDTERGLDDYFAALKEQAIKARQAGDDAKVRQLQDQVSKWGLEKYVTLLAKELPAAVEARDYILGAARLKGAGTFRLVDDASFGRCWTSSAQSNAQNMSRNFIDADFEARPDVHYRCHVFVGGCCQETMGLFLQGSEFKGTDAFHRQVNLEPGGPLYVIVNFAGSKAPATHTSQCSQKFWEWRTFDLPRYTTAGLKKLRILTRSQGYSVALVIISSDKYLAGPPMDPQTIRKLASEP